MTFKTRLFYTKILVIASAICSLLGVLVPNDIYPFSPYKLFTQPMGTKNTFTEYRIYSRPTLKENFKRNPIKETPSYDYDSYGYLFNFLTNKVIEKKESHDEYKQKLLLFSKHIVPAQAEYKIVSETYHPLDLLNKPNKYDTATVITF